MAGASAGSGRRHRDRARDPRRLRMTHENDDALVIAGRRLGSRLLMGTAGYPNQQVLLQALEAGAPAMVTVAIRRVSLESYGGSLLDALGSRYPLLPNTAG